MSEFEKASSPPSAKSEDSNPSFLEVKITKLQRN